MDGRITIESPTNPRVKRVVKLRKPRERRAAGVLIAEGRREVERAFAAGLEPVELFATGAFDDEVGGLARALKPSGAVPIDLASVAWVGPAVLEKMAYHAKPEGVLAVFREPRWTLDALPEKRDGFYLVAVGTEKPGNLGAMVRTAAVAGCDAVLAVGPAVDVFNPNTIRNSTGAVFALPTVVVDAADTVIAWLRQRNVAIAAALADSGADCFTLDWASPGAGLAVVVGPEHAGLDAGWRDAADVALTIPSAGSGEAGCVVDSLNASNAAAVLLFDAVRRRSVTARR
ncbi:MAG: RNA methyltransferase [Planctomycetota bacterium]